MDQRLRETAGRQAGVVSRRQMLEAGLEDHDIRRMLRRREWARVHDGVYVDHTGPPTWLQHAWAAVLAVWPAALARESALRADDGPGRRVPITDRRVCVAVDRMRNVVAPPGVRLVHVTDLDGRVLWNLSPPRVRVEDAVLDLAAAAPTDFAAIAILADAVQARRTTAQRLIDALERRRRVARRAFLAGVLRDVRDGTCSVLEHGYLTRVERPHALPRADRQVPGESRGRMFRDVTYQRYRTYVELDGRLFHDDPRARNADLDRDLDAAVEGRETLRLGWGQVFDRSCATAHKVGRVLAARGWNASSLTPCSSTCG
jgi:hypothetical protein